MRTLLQKELMFTLLPDKKNTKKPQKRWWQESRRGGVNLEKFDNTYKYYSGKHHKILINYRR